MKISELLSINMKRLRDERGFSQEKLAELCDKSKTWVQHIEGQRRWPESASIEVICKALGIEEHELFQIPQEEKKEPPKDETLDQIKALLAEKKPDLSHVPREFLDLAKNLPLSAKDGWEGMIDHLNFEIEEYQSELENGPRQYVTKEDIIKKEQEALSRPRLSDPLAGKRKF